MKVLSLLVVFAALCLSFSSAALVITQVSGAVSNTYLISNGTHGLLVDTGFYGLPNPLGDITTISTAITNSGVTLIAVYVTHPHPDHFSGLVQLNNAYPSATLYVKDLTFKAFLVGSIPNYIPLLSSEAAAFNYNGTLQVLPDPTQITIFAGEVIRVKSNFLPNECDLQSILLYDAGTALLSGDLIYVEDHLYLGVTVDATKVANWKAALAAVSAAYPTYSVYPGHGAIGTNLTKVISEDIGYLDFFMASLCTPGLNFTADIFGVMTTAYPTWGGTLAVQLSSGNPAWPAYIASSCGTDGGSSSSVGAASSDAMAQIFPQFSLVILASLLALLYSFSNQ